MEGLDPLHSDDPEAWDRLLMALGLPALIVVARERLGARLLARVEPQDIVQEALVLIWQRRDNLEWRGLAAFRALLVRTIEHRVLDHVGYSNAIKRSAVELPIGARNGSAPRLDPAISTTPSRLVVAADSALHMGEALDQLEEPTRSVVQLRHFEERTIAEVAEVLEISQSQVKHLLRKGLMAYGRLLGLTQESR